MTSLTFTLLDPVWLLLAVPLGWALWLWRPASRILLTLRALGWLALLLALCRPVLELPTRGGTLVVVADRSASMPPGADAAHGEALALLSRAQPPNHRLGVVTFGSTAVVEQPPQAAPFAGFRTPADRLGRDGSDLGSALEAALALIPEGEPGRLLVISDGRWSGADPTSLAGRAALRGIAVDFRPLARPAVGDLAVETVEAPAELRPGEAFTITAWVQSPSAGPVRYRLWRGEQVLAEGERTLPAGRGRLLFRDRATAPGTLSYRLEINSGEGTAEDAGSGSGDDPQPENNVARWLIGVRGPRPVLVVSDSGEGLARMLRDGGVEVRAASPEQVGWSLEDLSQYSAVLLDNVAADRLGGSEQSSEESLATLAAWVEGGGGLMMTGGRSAFGTGGYFRSPLEPVLPVSMELRREHRKLAVAVVVALDRSGSMAAAVGGGRTKMDLANLAAVQVLDLLTAMDEFGLVAVDSEAHIISPLRPVDELATSRDAMLRVESMGGGIYVYEALEAAAEQLLKAQAGTRHILLFADAADSEHPHEYRALLQRAGEAGITVSVVGLGTPGDGDAPLLKDIARLGGGQVYFTESAEQLPRLFAQDTFLIARSAFLEEPTAVRATGALTGLTGAPVPPTLPQVGAYNLTYLRPGADLAVVTQDEYGAPVVASWQAGLGRVLAYTVPLSGEEPTLVGDFAGGIARWSQYGAFLSSLTRWTAGVGEELAPGLLVRRRATPAGTRVELFLDPERETEPFTAPPTVTVVRAAPGRSPEVNEYPLTWESPDRLALDVPLAGDEVVTTAIEVPGVGRRTLAPARLPYPPELRPAEPGRGLATLEALARATGGRRAAELGRLWNGFPRTPRSRSLAPILALLTAVILLIEILERRTGLLGASLWRRPRKRPVSDRGGPGRRQRPAPAPQRSGTPAVQKERGASALAHEQEPPEAQPTEVPSSQDMLSALEKAQRRARGRTRR